MHVNNSINCSLRTSRLDTPPHLCTSEFGQEKQAYGHTRNVAWHGSNPASSTTKYNTMNVRILLIESHAVGVKGHCSFSACKTCNFGKLSLLPVITAAFSAGVTVAWKQQTANTSTNITRSIQSIKYTTESTWRNKKRQRKRRICPWWKWGVRSESARGLGSSYWFCGLALHMNMYHGLYGGSNI